MSTTTSTTTPFLRINADGDQIARCRYRVENLEPTFEKLSLILQRAGNEVRLKILFLLFEESELCVCDLTDILEMNVSAVSQHLRKLKDGGMLKVKRIGQTSFYSLNENYRELFTSCYELVANDECPI